MIGAPDPDPVPHRRRHSNAWNNTPKLAKIALGVCVVLAALSPFVLERSRAKALPPAPSMSKTFDALVAKAPKVDLVLSKSSLNLQTHRIEGVLTNTSSRAYSDIEITFVVASPDESSWDRRTVTVAVLAPHGIAKFATTPLGGGSDDWYLSGIKGTPVQSPAAAGEAFPPLPGR